MRKQLLISALFLLGFLSFPSVAYMQVTNNYWLLSSGVLKPILSTWQFEVPQLGGNGTRCVQVDNNGLFSVASAGCSSGGGGGTFAWTPTSYGNATNTTLGFLQGFTSPASSTVAGPFHLGLSDGELGINTGLVYSGATTTAGTGLTYSANSFNVNTTQNISTLSNLSTAGTVSNDGSGVLYSSATSTPTINAPLTYSGTLGQFIKGVSGAFGITQSGASTDGYLSSVDWNLFNNKISSSSLSQIFPFTPTTNFGAAANSTSTPIWFTAGLQSSSTIQSTGFNVDQFGSYMQNGTSTLYIGNWSGINANVGNATLSIGPSAGPGTTGNAGSIAIGAQALASTTTTKLADLAIGNKALLSNGAGNSMIAIGTNALLLYQGTTAGTGNIAVGVSSGAALLGTVAADDRNTFIGSASGNTITTGSRNLFLGYSAGAAQSSGDANIILGTRVNAPALTGSQQLDIGNILYGTGLYNNGGVNSSAPVAAGLIGIGSTTPYARLGIQANNNDTNLTLFAIGSTTASATTTLFSIDNTGSTTAANGITLTGGCFYYNGACLTSGGSGTVTSIAAGLGLNGGTITNTGTIDLKSYVATSSGETQGTLAYWTTTNGTPAQLGKVSTSTLTATSPLTGSFSVVGTTGSVGCQAASGTQAGCLSLSDWLTFNSKIATGTNFVSGNMPYWGVNGTLFNVATGTVSAGSSAITVTAGRSAIGGALAIDCAGATASQNGCLSSTDWSTFNNKIGWGQATSTSANQFVYTDPNNKFASIASSSVKLSWFTNDGLYLKWGDATSTSANQFVYTDNNGKLVSIASSTIKLSWLTNDAQYLKWGDATSTSANQSVYTNALGKFVSVATSSVSAGTGISLSAGAGALVGGSALTITNTGVTSLGNGTGINCSGTAPGSCSFATINAGVLGATLNGASPTSQATSTLYGTAPAGGQVLGWSNTTNGIAWIATSTGGGGTVTAVSVATANGFAGSSGGGATPALTLTTTITGLLKGNGTAISAAAYTDFPTISAGTVLANATGATAAPTAVATSSLYTGVVGQNAFFNGTGALIGTSSIFSATNSFLGLGTTTPLWPLDIFSTTPNLPQLALSAGQGIAHWFFANEGGNLYIGTTTVQGSATSTQASAVTVLNGGQLSTSEALPATSTTMLIDWSLTPNQVDIQLGTSATTIGFNNASTSGMTKRLIICNPSAAASTVTFGGLGILWVGGTAPVHTVTANKCDIYSFDVTQATSTSNGTTKVFGAASLSF